MLGCAKRCYNSTWVRFLILLLLFSFAQSQAAARSPRGPTQNGIGDGCAMTCPGDVHCLDCDFPIEECSLGSVHSLNCSTSSSLCDCEQPKRVTRQGKCRFCWQVDDSELECETLRNCSTNDVSLHKTSCRVRSNVICAGRRSFYKKHKCHWTSGYSWRKALFLSVTMGGFGVDRFYLGHWKSGVGKLFSFGGLGLWTLLDILLIGIGYIQPADESEYLI